MAEHKHLLIADEPKQGWQRGHFRWRLPRVLAILVVSLALLTAAAVIAYQWAYSGRIYPGVATADGLTLGSLTREAAAEALAQQADTFLKDRLRLSYGDREWLIPVDDFVVRHDVDDLVDVAYGVGRQGNVFQQLAGQLPALRFGQVVKVPVLTFDERQAAASFGRLAKEIHQPVIDARLVVDGDLEVRIVPSQVGQELNVDRAVQLVAQALAAHAGEAVELPVVEMPPSRAERDLTSARVLVGKMLSGPLTLQFGDRIWTLTRQDIAGLIVRGSSAATPAKLVALDEDSLAKFVRRLAEEIDQMPIKPRLQYAAGQVRVIREERPGSRLDTEGTVDAIKTALTGDSRTVALPVDVTMPAGMAEDRLAIKERVASATTSYAGGLAERRFNVELAAAKLNGTVVGPGEIFSFNEELGPMTLQAGFKWGWGISQAQGQVLTVPSVAGGICQVSTTLFQAIFWAGYQVEERNWHLYWIDRYGQPPTGLKGLDATVDQVYDAKGNLAHASDLKFKNTTSYPILIEARTDGARLTFNLYSTRPDWEVKVDGPRIEDVAPADRAIVREQDRSLPPGRELWIEAAQDGFKSTIVRTVVEPARSHASSVCRAPTSPPATSCLWVHLTTSSLRR